ncbi:integrating conjugative element protein [Paracidovorax citrulli]|uniref:PFL_4695 family integrating conjugative element protein n=1 Tax=Paracidovorax citrulli TaxID=80869 RepID=UPI00255C85FE|nr:integrating conjugative element protein [Paracidovorax citrulli]WIY36607.1 integrating conjugative element protein [Paracidovorax citrulli]
MTMQRRSILHAAALLAGHLPGLAAAAALGLDGANVALQIIHDSGRGVPMAPYLAQLAGDADDPGALSGVPYPFVTRRLRGGVLQVEGTPVFQPEWLTEAVFVVAADDVSLRWLAFNHARLVQMQAVGVVVQAGTAAAYQMMQRLARPMRLAPDSGEWVSERLAAAGAGVYPVLVQTDGRAYQILTQDTGPAASERSSLEQPMPALVQKLPRQVGGRR